MLQLSDAAVGMIRDVLSQAQEPLAGLRILVEAGGCAGYKYGLALEAQTGPGDTVIHFEDVAVIVDEGSASLLEQVTVDYVNGLEGSGFAFHNAAAASSCGCGKSFSC